MPRDTIQKALKGNSSAMLSLYEESKAKTMSLCLMLLQSEKDADEAMVEVYTYMFRELVAGRITSEAEFERLTIRKAIMYCKTKVQKQSPKAFAVSEITNFTKCDYQMNTMTFGGEVHEIVLHNLPVFLRFVYVIHTDAGYSTMNIGHIFNVFYKVVENALKAESVHVTEIVSIASSYMKMSITMSTEMFHERLKNAYKYVKITNAVSTIIRLRVNELCEPLQKKEKKKNTIVLSSIATVMLAVVIAVGASMMQTEDTGIDLDNANPSRVSTSESDTDNDTADLDFDEAASSIADIKATSDYTAEITIENYGTISLALFSEVAPETAANFVSLAESGFYDGLTFHRIMDGFMMQGGDPSGDGTGGSENTVTGEFSANGFENNLPHSRGAISMARADDYNSASSQFFIVHEDSIFLDGQYAVFGYVTEGMDIVDMICTTAEPTDENGTIPADEQPVITSITVYKNETSTETGVKTTVNTVDTNDLDATE